MPSRASQLTVYLTCILMLVAAAAFGADSLRRVGRDATHELDNAHVLAVGILIQEHALDQYLVDGNTQALLKYENAQRSVQDALSRLRSGVGRSEHGETGAFERIAESATEWISLADLTVADRSGPRRSVPVTRAARHGAVDRFIALIEAYRGEVLAEADAATQSARITTAAAGAGAGLFVVLLGHFLLWRPMSRMSGRRAQSSMLIDALQLAHSESEAYGLLTRFLDMTLRRARTTVLGRNNSENRLEARSPVAEGSPLHGTLAHAEPRSCLAVRRGLLHDRELGREGLLECDVCGALESASTCVPALVAGEVIGAVLVEHDRHLRPGELAHISQSVAAAAPVVASLRSVELAELRASTDALTGLANVRAADETLKRLHAQAGRTKTPLSALMVDLDHFKEINDVYGHSAGDAALAAVGGALAQEVRTSDFVARYGGEEFLVLLPSTDRAGAVAAAEHLRQAIAGLKVSEVGRSITASFGVASVPEDAADSDELVRMADRALYSAKSAGRNRVETVDRSGKDEPVSVPEPV